MKLFYFLLQKKLDLIQTDSYTRFLVSKVTMETNKFDVTSSPQCVSCLLFTQLLLTPTHKLFAAVDMSVSAHCHKGAL